MAGSRIALVIHALYGGGAERLMAQLAERWSRAGLEIHLITWAERCTDEYQVPLEVQRHGLDLMRTSRGLLDGIRANFLRVRRLRSTLQQIDPELVLSFSDQMNIVTLEATRNLNMPVWISEHSDPSKQRLGRLWEAWRRRTYPGCAGCIVLTEEIAKIMAGWVPAHKIRVIPPAINAPTIAEQTSASEVQGGRRTILSVGRLSAEKGIDLLLMAWQRIHDQLPSWKLRIVGDGQQRAQLEQLASGLPRVEFAGWLDDPWPAYQDASMFVLPSRYEGFPVALLEAMSQGVACIATDCTAAIHTLNGISECIEVIELREPAELANALLRAAGDDGLREKMGQAAVSVAGHYRWTTIGKLWDRILDDRPT